MIFLRTCPYKQTLELKSRKCGSWNLTAFPSRGDDVSVNSQQTHTRSVRTGALPGPIIFSFFCCLCVLAICLTSFVPGGRSRVFTRSKRGRLWRFLWIRARSGVWRLFLFVFTATRKVTVQDSSSWQLKDTTGAINMLLHFRKLA